MATESLLQQKLRMLLNVFGVAVGATLLILSFATAEGVKRSVTSYLQDSNILNIISVSRDYNRVDSESIVSRIELSAEIPEPRRDRLKDRIAQEWLINRNRFDSVELTPSLLEQISADERVDQVVPRLVMQGNVTFQEIERSPKVSCIHPLDPTLAERLVMGRIPAPTESGQILISEYLAYSLNGARDRDFEALIGSPIEVRFRPSTERFEMLFSFFAGAINQKQAKDSSEGSSSDEAEEKEPINLSSLERTDQFSEAAKLLQIWSDFRSQLEDEGVSPTSLDIVQSMLMRDIGGSSERDFTDVEQGVVVLECSIAGIVRERESDASVGIVGIGFDSSTCDLFLPLDQCVEIANQNPSNQRDGYAYALVSVDSPDMVAGVSAELQELGLRTDSILENFEGVDQAIRVVKYVLMGIAGVIFLVSGTGIANTMLMSVLQRRHEIGVMKAVGATDRQVLAIFLIEGLLIGVIGFSAAATVAMAGRQVLESAILRMLEGRTRLPEDLTILYFSPTTTAILLGFVCLVTLLATAVPAWRASRVDPVEALRN